MIPVRLTLIVLTITSFLSSFDWGVKDVTSKLGERLLGERLLGERLTGHLEARQLNVVLG